CDLWGDPKVMALIDSRGGLSREQVQEKLEKEVENHRKFGVQYWKLVDRKTSELVGCCGLRPWAFSDQGPEAREIGFHIVSREWGKGYATEAARAVMEHAFHFLKLPKLFSGHNPKNANSAAILKKLGFRHVEDVFYPPTGLMHPCYELVAPR